MARRTVFALLAAAVFAGKPALSATITVSVADRDGKPAGGAVVELVSTSENAGLPTKVAAEAIIDQRNEMFIPLVTVIRKGGHVIFTNNDTTMHQVYSFSAIKQFEFEIDEGQRSAPVVFSQSGVAAIGCNIHDQMITYVYVAATPWIGLTAADGKTSIADVPPGTYRASVWHPRLVPGQVPPAIPLSVSGDTAKLSASVSLVADSPRGKKRMHMQIY